MENKGIRGHLPVLETERLILRKVRTEDTNDVFAYASNDEVSRYVTWDSHESLSNTQSFIDFILEEYHNDNFVCWGIELKTKQKLIGTIDFVHVDPKNKVGEIGYVLSQDYWGQGLMTEAVKEVIQFGFQTMGLVRIQARCFVENIGSETVMKKSGMSYEGTIRKGIFAKGKHQDLSMYAILQDDLEME